ncbi:MAG: hypothetical protein EZS28_006658 [Streblomastix strix]|uniref:Uncharacterized protein n=1 Tax=Streblomastix strix TaxID=222440 RepID=A0A5J4WSB7_9EUKA|nr:MAG: hypothetical protein EZS28_006658 [Streblomastix strix]
MNLQEEYQKISQTELSSYETMNVDSILPSTQGQHAFIQSIQSASIQKRDIIYDQNLITAKNTFLNKQTMENADTPSTHQQGSLVGKERTFGNRLEKYSKSSSHNVAEEVVTGEGASAQFSANNCRNKRLKFLVNGNGRQDSMIRANMGPEQVTGVHNGMILPDLKGQPQRIPLSYNSQTLSTELEEGIIEITTRELVKCWNTTIIVPKPFGGWRKILDATKLNDEIKLIRFQMLGVDDVKMIIQIMFRIIKLDLKSTLHQLKVYEQFGPYLAFEMVGVGNRYKGMHLRNKYASIFFTESMNRFLAELRKTLNL